LTITFAGPQNLFFSRRTWERWIVSGDPSDPILFAEASSASPHSPDITNTLPHFAFVRLADQSNRSKRPRVHSSTAKFALRAYRTAFHTHGFLPAARPKALTCISRAIRRWALHHHSDKSLQDLAKMYNPYIEGWINYFGQFYRTHLRPTLKRIDVYVIRWARRKFKRLRRKTKGARDWFAWLRRANPTLFAHWQLCHGNGRTSGAV
jgi:group II intron maturase